MSVIEWTKGSRDLTCRACGFGGSGSRVAKITANTLVAHEILRCPECGSIQIIDEALPSSSDDIGVDIYIEVGAGIGTIADVFDHIDTAKVRKFLDVGCGYGFAGDLGRFSFGWEVTGVEPSLAGVRGAHELSLDIRNEYLMPSSEIDNDFDLVLASEVVEHVPDPVGFLAAIRARLAPDGVVLLTTPAAEIVSKDAFEVDVLAALSPGFHVFVASARGLEVMLAEAGFASFSVKREHGTLRAIASNLPALPERPRQTRATDLVAYTRWRADNAAKGSALELGMLVRYIRLTVAQGRYREAAAAAPQVSRSMGMRYGIELSDLSAAVLGAASRSDLPLVLAGAAFALGMLELQHFDRPMEAAKFFRLAELVASGWIARTDAVDLDTPDVLYQSALHRVIALSKCDVSLALADGEKFVRTEFSGVTTRAHSIANCRILVDLVAGGAATWGSLLAGTVARDALVLAKDRDDGARVAALDALYSLGNSAKSAGQERAARSWFSKCIKACRSAPTPGGHSERLTALCAARLSAPAVSRPAPVEPDREIKYFIDVYWCDAYGTFLEGWAHADELVVDSLTVRIGAGEAVATLTSRLDILPFWPDVADASRAGFRAYVPGRPQSRVTLVASTARGVIETAISLPDHPLPVHSRALEEQSVLLRAASFIASAPPGPVLAVGIRSPNREILAARLAVFGDREVIGLDIHEGIGVDVVGDAHTLSAYFPAEQFAIVYSESVLEHLVAPWLFAVECARVLKPGGRAIHLAPWAWPTHAEPNDFFRYSEEGLESLFTESIGFRTIATGVDGAAIITPTPRWRTEELKMPTTLSAMGSWIVAEKRNDAARSISWPYDPGSGVLAAKSYPIDGLAEPKAQP